jgi:hypothetical protein
MMPRRHAGSNVVFRLPGGTEDNDLWSEVTNGSDGIQIRSLWVPSDEERKQIAEGANIELIVWGGTHPPVAVVIADKKPLREWTEESLKKEAQ